MSSLPPQATRLPGSKIRRCAAFSLVEVVLAVGIVGSVFTVLTGLMATGLTTFRQSSDRMISAQISQAILSEVSRSDWASLVDVSSGEPKSFSVGYFNGAGEKVSSSGEAIYIARPVLFSPSSANASSQASPVSLAGADYSSMGAARIVRVVVEVMHQPGGAEPTVSGGLWNPAQKDRLRRFSSFLVRNR